MELSALFPNMGFFKWIFRIFWQSFSLSLNNATQNLWCLHSRQVMSGLVWATGKGKTQTCWPRQTHKPNWETPSPHGFFSSLLSSCEKTQFPSMRAGKRPLPNVEHWVLKQQRSKVPAQKREKDFPERFGLHILNLPRVSVGKAGDQLLCEKEVGKEITNLKWLGVSFWGCETEVCWFKVGYFPSSLYSTFKQVTSTYTGFSRTKSYKEARTKNIPAVYTL